MADFRKYLKQEEISMQAVNSLVCNGIICDICHSGAAVKIIPNKLKIQRKFHIESQAIKVCVDCLEQINEMR